MINWEIHQSSLKNYYVIGDSIQYIHYIQTTYTNQINNIT